MLFFRALEAQKRIFGQTFDLGIFGICQKAFMFVAGQTEHVELCGKIAADFIGRKELLFAFDITRFAILCGETDHMHPRACALGQAACGSEFTVIGIVGAEGRRQSERPAPALCHAIGAKAVGVIAGNAALCLEKCGDHQRQCGYRGKLYQICHR
tara:strand:+ start:507 stop:971 length:465 start_codon:yes stop_codon:yes gene_type:complete